MHHFLFPALVRIAVSFALDTEAHLRVVLMIRFKFKSNFTKSYIDARYRTIHNVDITFSLTTAVAAAVAFFQRIIRRRAEKEIKTKRATKQTRSCLKDEQEKERVNLGLRV